MQEVLQSDQLHRLHDAGIADDQKAVAALLKLLGELHQGTETGGIEEIDAAEVENHGLGSLAEMAADELDELLVGVGVELAREAEQQALGLLLNAPAKRNGQSLQFGDGSSPLERGRAEV